MWRHACRSLSIGCPSCRAKPRLLVTVSIVLLVPFTTDATSIPPDPHPSYVSGTWLALEKSGDICRLDVDVEEDSGELVCTIGDGLFRAAIQSVALKHLRLTITLEKNETLSGDVIYDRFVATYNGSEINFIKLARVKTALEQLGGGLSMGRPLPDKQ